MKEGEGGEGGEGGGGKGEGVAYRALLQGREKNVPSWRRGAAGPQGPQTATDGLCACESENRAICNHSQAKNRSFRTLKRSNPHVTSPQDAIAQQLFLVVQFQTVGP